MNIKAEVQKEEIQRKWRVTYIVDGNPNHKVWGYSKKHILQNFPDLKEKKLLFVQRELIEHLQE